MIAELLLAVVATQADVPAPSAAAMVLAAAASGSPPSTEQVETAAGGIANGLLNGHAAWRGVGCDPANAACRAAADRLGRESAPALLAESHAARTRLLATVIDETMTAGEIAQATPFIRTSAGRSFALALDLLANPAAMPPALLHKLRATMVGSLAGASGRGLIDRFYDMTAGLPRRTLPMVPPPPMPSPPARKP